MLESSSDSSSISVCVVIIKFISSSHLVSIYNNASLILVFCAAESVVGNLTLISTRKSPLVPGFLEIGIPWPGKVCIDPGCVGPAPLTGNCFPSIVVTLLCHPVKASFKSSSMIVLRLSPSLFRVACGFSDTMK